MTAEGKDSAPRFDRDEWMRTHKGPLIRVYGYVWWCGDDVCGCSQAQIVEEYRNLVVSRAVVPIRIWEGQFHTDHEYEKSDADLAAKREELRQSDPEMEARIEWLEAR